jgi:hypothetical protein
MRSEENFMGKTVLNLEVYEKRTRGRPKSRWKDCLEKDLKYINSWQQMNIRIKQNVNMLSRIETDPV